MNYLKTIIKLENPNIDQVLLNYLEGRSTTDEIETLRNWMNDSEDHKAIFESTKLYWENSHLKIQSSNLDDVFEKLKARQNQNLSEQMLGIQTKRIVRKLNWYKVAAVFVVFFTIAGMIYYLNVADYQIEEISVVQKIVKENPKGQKLTTYLPDGSKVILNSQSRIEYGSTYNDTERLIELEGEAFFEVKRDSSKPFMVVAKGVTTTALGTSFNVNCVHEQNVEVTLVSGKVSVYKRSDHSMILNPGYFAAVSHEGEIEVAKFDYLEKVGWKDGVLAFKDNTLSEIIVKLEDWYGVEFITIGKMEHEFHYTGTYKNESLEEVLHGISFVHNFKFKIIGDTVKIYASEIKLPPMN